MQRSASKTNSHCSERVFRRGDGVLVRGSLALSPPFNVLYPFFSCFGKSSIQDWSFGEEQLVHLACVSQESLEDES